MENASNYRFVIVTTNSYDNAQHIARIIISEGLAACCSLLLGAYSIYSWENKIQEALEVVLFIKTSAVRLDSLEERIRELHPYQTPEIVALPLESGSAAFLKWIDSVVSPNDILE